jgi:hypothetical protein
MQLSTESRETEAAAFCIAVFLKGEDELFIYSFNVTDFLCSSTVAV